MVSVVDYRVVLVYLPIFGIMYHIFTTCWTVMQQVWKVRGHVHHKKDSMQNECYYGTSTLKAFGKQNEYLEKKFTYINMDLVGHYVDRSMWGWFDNCRDFTSLVFFALIGLYFMHHREESNLVLVIMVLR